MKRHAVACLGILLAAGQAQAAEESLPQSPMILDNCGQYVQIDRPPRRVVTVNQSATELLLALGLRQRMIGTAYLDAPVRTDLLLAYNQVPILAAKAPGKEGVLAVQPDFIYAAFGGMFSEATLGSRTSLHELGIATYVSPVFCPRDGASPLTLEDILGEIADIGAIFQAEAKAAELTAAIRQQAARAHARWQGAGRMGPRVFLFDMDERTPYTAGGLGSQHLLLTLAGGVNIFADLKARMANVSWEAIAERDPDYIILSDSLWSSAAHKLELLHSNPALRQIRAVREGRLLALPFPDLMPGIRFGATVERLAQAFWPE